MTNTIAQNQTPSKSYIITKNPFNPLSKGYEMTDKRETFCRYQNTDEARAFREAIEERAETQAPEEVSPAVNLIHEELKEFRRSWAVGNPGSGMMKHS